MDVTEVTNAQFQKFVDETGYITTAELALDWDEIKKDLPPNTPKPDPQLLAPSSLVFKKNDKFQVSITICCGGNYYLALIGGNLGEMVHQ